MAIISISDSQKNSANGVLVADASSKIPAKDGSQITVLNATNVASGTIATARLDTGTAANKIVVLDGSGNLPVVDGSQLTGIVSATISASDPTVSTNPSGGVGTEWHNTTSGEVYICTDATTGANVWTNVGAGSGDFAPWPDWSFPAETYGYMVGGYVTGVAPSNAIDKWSLPNGGTATDHGDLSITSNSSSGHSSETYGYVSIGYTSSSPTYNNRVDKFAFAANTTATDHCDLSVARSGACAHWTQTHGYNSGGRISDPSATNVIDKFAFDSTSTATDWGDIGSNRYAGGGQSSSTHGFHPSGQDGSDGYIQTIYKFPFASNAGSSSHGDIGMPGTGNYGGSGASDQSGGNGYQCGGSGSPGYTTDIKKFAFASNTTASDHGDLSNGARYGFGGISGTSYGFALGGYSGGPGNVNILDKFAYSSNTTATDVGDMVLVRTGGDGCGY